MQSLIKKYVFQPPRDNTSMEYIMLQQKKHHFRYITKNSTEHISYVHFKSHCHSHGWYNVHNKPLVILYSHGNAETLGMCYNLLELISRALNIDVIGYDYCGYGLSGIKHNTWQSTIDEKTVNSDVECVYLSMKKKMGYSASQIILMGRSVGGGPTSYLASKYQHEIAGVILQSTFTSCLGVVFTGWVPRCLPFIDMFNNSERLRKVIQCPLLFMHGELDGVVPFRCSEQLLRLVIKERERAHNASMKKFKKEHQEQQQEHEYAKSRRLFGNNTHKKNVSTPETEHKSTHEHQCYNNNHNNSGNNTTIQTLVSSEHTHLESYETSLLPSSALPHSENDNSIRVTGNNSCLTNCCNGEEFGVFHGWFSECGHNDIETRSLEIWIATLRRFLSYVSLYDPEAHYTKSSTRQ